MAWTTVVVKPEEEPGLAAVKVAVWKGTKFAVGNGRGDGPG